VSFLGECVNGSGIHPDQNKVSAITNMPIPTNVSEVRRFLGAVNQLELMSKFIPDKLQPLHELLVKTNSSSGFGAKPQEKAFRLIKRELTGNSVLALFNPNVETVMHHVTAWGQCRERARQSVWWPNVCLQKLRTW
jgi:hypothetical protein